MTDDPVFEWFFWGTVALIVAGVIMFSSCIPAPEDEPFRTYIGCLKQADCPDSMACDKSAGGIIGICKEKKKTHE
jgi:hypothetical protein